MLWDQQDTCDGFEAYRDYPEELLGYRWLLDDIARSRAPDQPEQVVLDFGCGPGKCALRLALHGHNRIIAVDQAEPMLTLARARRSHPKIDYRPILHDVLDLPEHSVDAAVACFVFINTESVARIVAALRTIRHALKPAGSLYILDTNPATTGRRFSTFISGEPGRQYETGEARVVRLFHGERECLVIKDYHWPKQCYLDGLAQAGFRDVEVFEPTLADVPPPRHEAFFAEHGFAAWRDETQYPPFILFKANGIRPD